MWNRTVESVIAQEKLNIEMGFVDSGVRNNPFQIEFRQRFRKLGHRVNFKYLRKGLY